MLSFRRLLDRMTDRRPTLRPSRSRRRRSPWRSVALLVAVLLLTSALLAWSQMSSPPRGRVAVIVTGPAGELQLDGRRVSLAELEAGLRILRGGEMPLLVAISGPSLEGPPAMPPPEVAGVLARLHLNWMSAPQIGMAVLTPKERGGDHGR